MKRWLQKLVVGVVLRVVHAALVELYRHDTRVRAEMDALPERMSYAIYTGHEAPALFVLWRRGRLRRLGRMPKPVCCLQVKSLAHAFQLFTGQMGLAQAYARHAFTMKGEIADVMRLARLVNLVEAYLFPKFITRHILTDIPELEVTPLRVYGSILRGFVTLKYIR